MNADKLFQEHSKCVTGLNDHKKYVFIIGPWNTGNLFPCIVVSIKVNLSAKADGDKSSANELLKLLTSKNIVAKDNLSSYEKISLKEKLKSLADKKMSPAADIDSEGLKCFFVSKREEVAKLKSIGVQYFRATSEKDRSFYISVGYGYLELVIKKGLKYVEDLIAMYIHFISKRLENINDEKVLSLVNAEKCTDEMVKVLKYISQLLFRSSTRKALEHLYIQTLLNNDFAEVSFTPSNRPSYFS